MNDEQPPVKTEKEQLLELSRHMPAEAVIQLKKVLLKFCEEYEIPFDTQTLKACLIPCMLIQPNLPPVYAQFTSSLTLLLTRLVDEEESGLITSPLQPIK